MKNIRLLPFVAVLSAAMLAGCGGGGSETRTLTVEFVQAGFGLTPYEDLAKAFEKEHPDVTVKLVPNRSMADTTATRIANGNASDVMIYNRSVDNIRLWAKQGYVYDLTDAFKEEVENGETLEQRLDANALSASEYDGGHWCIPEYYNIHGFVYNATLFEAKGWSVPATTKEFEELCTKISQTTAAGKKISPIVFCQDADGYLYFADEGWTVAYEGVSNMDTFFAFGSPEVYNPTNLPGKVKGLELQKKYFFDSGYAMEGSKTMGATEAQSKLFDYEAAMMLDGSWFETEMSDYYTSSSPTFKMFKLPEISDSEGNVLHADGYTTDADNHSVVSAEFASNIFIPSCAKNKEDAIEFLKFSSKRSSCELWTKDSNAVRPFNYDYSPSNSAYANMSEFGKSILEIANNSRLYVPDSKADIAVIGHAGFRPQGYWHWKFSSVYTPEYCAESDYEYAVNNWDSWVREAQETFGN